MADEAKLKEAEARARAEGWVTETERHGIDTNRGVVHPDGWWAPDWRAVIQKLKKESHDG